MARGATVRLGVGVVIGLVLVGCSSGSSAPEVTTVSSTAPSSTVASAEVPVGDTTTTEQSTTTTPALSLASLPGRLALLSAGCGGAAGDISSLSMQVCIVDPDGTDLVLASDPSLDAGYPGWSNDGSVLYYVDDRGTVYVNADGTGQRVRAQGESPFPGESPDGAWVVYSPYGDPGFVIEPAGGGTRNHVVTSPDACCQIARWSPDSRSLVYTAFTPGTQECAQLWRVDIDTRATTPLTGPGSRSADREVCVELDSGRWSPDGSAILFMEEGGDSGNWRPYLVGPDGSDLRPLLDEAAFDDPEWLPMGMAWSPDGRAIALAVFAGIRDGLFMVSPDGSTMLEVDLPGSTVAGLSDIAWAPGL